jgi:hypothetical protein
VSGPAGAQALLETWNSGRAGFRTAFGRGKTPARGDALLDVSTTNEPKRRAKAFVPPIAPLEDLQNESVQRTSFSSKKANPSGEISLSECLFI